MSALTDSKQPFTNGIRLSLSHLRKRRNRNRRIHLPRLRIHLPGPQIHQTSRNPGTPGRKLNHIGLINRHTLKFRIRRDRSQREKIFNRIVKSRKFSDGGNSSDGGGTEESWRDLGGTEFDDGVVVGVDCEIVDCADGGEVALGEGGELTFGEGGGVCSRRVLVLVLVEMVCGEDLVEEEC